VAGWSTPADRGDTPFRAARKQRGGVVSSSGDWRITLLPSIALLSLKAEGERGFVCCDVTRRGS